MRTLVLSLLVALVATPALALAGPAQASTTPAPASPTATSAPDPAADKAAKEKAAKQEAAKKKAAKAAKKKAAKAARKKAARQKARRAAARNWDRLAECESNGRWRIDTGNGYYGGLQISPRTWRAFGGARIAALPHHATKKQQIKVATRIKKGQGWGAWPSCSRRVGLR